MQDDENTESATELAPLAEESEQHVAMKRAEGRYTLREAAKEIARNGHGDERDLLHRLKTAWASGNLAAFKPGSTVSCTSSSLHPDYLEVYWVDLNAWLAKNEPHSTFQFPAPGDGSIRFEGPAGDATSGVTVTAQASASDTDMVETPGQHRARVAEALERNNGNKAATGRELGISAERVRQLVTPKSPKGNANEVTNTAHDPFAKTLQQKSIKRR